MGAFLCGPVRMVLDYPYAATELLEAIIFMPLVLHFLVTPRHHYCLKEESKKTEFQGFSFFLPINKVLRVTREDLKES